MKNVLMIAYFWPPDNAAGTHRSLRFARHLREFNWEPIVLTAKPIWYTRYDPNLVTRVPEGIKIIRAPHSDLWLSFQNLRGKKITKINSSLSFSAQTFTKNLQNKSFNWRSYVRRFKLWVETRVYHPDYYMGWIHSAISTAKKNFPSGKGIDVIWATGGPWSDFEVGYQLAQCWNLPLVIDFRDGWTITYNDFEERRPPWARRKDRHRLTRYFQRSSAIVFLTETYAECYSILYGRFLDNKKIYIIPNGFEPEPIESTPPKGVVFSILYTGLLSSRKFDTLFRALAKLIFKGEVKNIEILFVGEENEEALSLVSQLNLSRYVHFYPAQPYEKIQDMLKKAHTLLILGEMPMRGMELFVASKIFNYLSMGRPVMGVLPDTESRKVLLSLGSGLVADVDSIDEIENLIRKLYLAWETETLDNYLIFSEELKNYSEPNLTSALVTALEFRKPYNPFQSGKAAISTKLLDYLNKTKLI